MNTSINTSYTIFLPLQIKNTPRKQTNPELLKMTGKLTQTYEIPINMTIDNQFYSAQLRAVTSKHSSNWRILTMTLLFLGLETSG